ncbi:hypothetical protein [Stratiformator vulcanicus]|uniref:Plasmid stabilization system protein n=1 Tax=Stratiformator vulcanicus TaxID=2527980 RepID=A0A517QXF7_9PLAN|nr:hypothetical protein [Stratiformator vulcanicus]QDT36321.1 hypothetical protein Pan189_06770 [Stratiformator vulcanicus]
MPRPIRLTAETESQLAQATAWYQERSGISEIARQWYDGFLIEMKKLRFIEDEIGLTPLQEQEFFEERLFELHYGSGRNKTHRAIFRFVGGTIEIVTIRHLSQRGLTNDDLKFD